MEKALGNDFSGKEKSEKKADPNKKWIVAPAEKVIEVYEALPEALRGKDADRIKKILEDPQLMRGAILDRSRNKGKNLIELREGFELLFMEKFGPEKNLYSIESEKIIQWIQETELPETTLTDMMGIAYHLKDHRRFFRLMTIISEGENLLKDKTVMATALQNLASWEGTNAKGSESAIRNNKEALIRGKEQGDLVLQTKSEYGLTFNKDLKPKDKIKDFEKYAERFQELGDDYDALQARNEAARAYLALAERQAGSEKRSLRVENLEKAEQMALSVMKEGVNFKAGGKIQYSNALYKAQTLLSEIYRAMGERKKSEEFKKMANQTKRQTGYRYV